MSRHLLLINVAEIFVKFTWLKWSEAESKTAFYPPISPSWTLDLSIIEVVAWNKSSLLLKIQIKSAQTLQLFLYWCYLWNENKRVRWNLYFNWCQNNWRKGFYVKWKEGEREQGNGETERERACVWVRWSKPTIASISIHNSVSRETHLWGYQMVGICDQLA
jgi:hypothetical protein